MKSRRYGGLMAFVLPALALSAPAQDERAAGSSPPPLPWADAERAAFPPGRPGVDYTPVVAPNNFTLAFRLVDGVKVFHLVAEPVTIQMSPGLEVDAWGYNGNTPGPVIEVVEGDRVRVYVSNRLPEATSVHWHGIRLPAGMDGLSGLTQKEIAPGETFRYEFIFPHEGTFMYHPHYDEMTQMGMGLMGMIVVHPRSPKKSRADRDFSMMLSEWYIKPGTRRPDPNAMEGFNVLTINSRAFPGTDPLVVKRGDRVRMRFGNLSAMDHHPVHLHGHRFFVTETDGGQIPEAGQWPETTVLVPVGSTRAVEFVADNSGDWGMHCHMTHHVMNQMGHGLPNLLGINTDGLDEKIRELIPGYMTMGQTGMGGMGDMGMPVPSNSIPMLGKEGPFGYIDMGGMFTILKVREGITNYDDPGWFQYPAGSVARPATPEELEQDSIVPPGGQEGADSMPGMEHKGQKR